MSKKYSIIIFLLLLISNVSIGQKEDGYVTTKLTKRIKKMVSHQQYEEAYKVVLQNKKSLGYYFSEKFSDAYQNSQWIDTVSVDSSRLFEGKDKRVCVGMFLTDEYTSEFEEGIEKRILVKKGNPAIREFLHFGNFVKLSDKQIRKIKRKLKRKGWYKGKINTIWDDYARRQLVYFSILETKYHNYPINLHDKYEVYEYLLHFILPPKPLPKKIAKRVGYKNARSIEKIKISTFNNSENSYKEATLTERKNIRHFIHLLSRLKKVKKIEQKEANSIKHYWRIRLYAKPRSRQRSGELYIMKTQTGSFVHSRGAYYHSTQKLMEFINQL